MRASQYHPKDAQGSNKKIGNSATFNHSTELVNIAPGSLIHAGMPKNQGHGTLTVMIGWYL